MVLDDLRDAVEFPAGESSTALEPDWVEPELRLAIVALDVGVRRFVPITRIEEETIRAASQDRRLKGMLRFGADEDNP